MVMPMGGIAGLPLNARAPSCVREASAKWWWVLVGAYTILCIMRVFAQDMFGAFTTVLMAYWAHYMVKQDCAGMSQHCVFLFGALSFFQFSIDAVNLLSCLHGREVEQTRSTPLVDNNGVETVRYSVTIVQHGFFNTDSGFISLYNYQSILLLLIPMCDMLGILVSSYSYNAFPTSLFEDSDDELEWSRVMGDGGARTDGGGSQSGYGSMAGDLLARIQGTNPQRANQQLGAFEGTSCRLGAIPEHGECAKHISCTPETAGA